MAIRHETTEITDLAFSRVITPDDTFLGVKLKEIDRLIGVCKLYGVKFEDVADLINPENIESTIRQALREQEEELKEMERSYYRQVVTAQPEREIQRSIYDAPIKFKEDEARKRAHEQAQQSARLEAEARAAPEGSLGSSSRLRALRQVVDDTIKSWC